MLFLKKLNRDHGISLEPLSCVSVSTSPLGNFVFLFTNILKKTSLAMPFLNLRDEGDKFSNNNKKLIFIV